MTVASPPELAPVAEAIAADWAAVGLQGHFLARNLDTDEEVGFGADTPVPLASVAKVPIALVVLNRMVTGGLDPATPVTLDPATRSLGSTGVAAFTYPVTLAAADCVFQMLSVSDNACADALLGLVDVAEIDRTLRGWGCTGVVVRHPMQRLYECAVGLAGHDFGVALELAVRDYRPGGDHPIETLDAARGNVGSAAALVELLRRVWRDEIADPRATARLRELMRRQVFSHRLGSDLRSDSLTVAAKTGTFLHLRHEVAVVESDAADRVAIAALTHSTRRATIAPDLDLAIGAAARTAFEALCR